MVFKKGCIVSTAEATGEGVLEGAGVTETDSGARGFSCSPVGGEATFEAEAGVFFVAVLCVTVWPCAADANSKNAASKTEN
jgi:hypothetical protein